MKRAGLSGLLLFLILSGCASAPKLDLTTFVTDREAVIRVPDICKPRYDAALPYVAVVNFTNNTTFDYVRIMQSRIQGSGFQADAQSISAEVNAKLGASIEAGVTDEIVNTGGAKVITRSEMNKVFEEQQFQQSGIVDDATMIDIGKIKGVKYIVTGSINNVDMRWISHPSTRQGLGKGGSGSLAFDLIGVAIAASLEAQEGWHIGAEVTLRILDVESGEVLLSKKMNGRHNIGRIPYPNYDVLIGGIKKAAGKSLQAARPELSKYFPLKGYITMIKNNPEGKKKAVRINIGESEGIRPGDELFVYTFEEVDDPMSGGKECDIQRLPVTLVVSRNQLRPDAAWALVKAKTPEQLRTIRVGQLVERKTQR